MDASSGFELPVIHHLAAKGLISDWSNGQGWSSTALTDECKKETIQLSIESSVICQLTAFVAYDEDQSQTIEGAIQVWDLAASMAKQNQIGAFRRGRGGGGGGPPPYGNAGPPPFGGAGPPPPGGAPFPSARQMLPRAMAAAPCAMMLGACPPPPPQQLKSEGLSYPPAGPKLSKKRKSAPVSAASRSASYKTSEDQSDSLTVLVSLQQAAGFWMLKDVASKVIKMEEKALACPPKVSGEVWGTVLALTFLEACCAKQKDEWELIAMKADMWLESQALPEGVTLDSLKLIAKTAIPAEVK